MLRENENRELYNWVGQAHSYIFTFQPLPNSKKWHTAFDS